MMLSLLITVVPGKQKLSIQSRGYALKNVVSGWGEAHWALHLMVSPTPSLLCVNITTVQVATVLGC